MLNSLGFSDISLLLSNYHEILDVPDDEFNVYSDDVNKFKISIPRGILCFYILMSSKIISCFIDAYIGVDWQVGSGEGDGIRSLTAFYPQDASASNGKSC